MSKENVERNKKMYKAWKEKNLSYRQAAKLFDVDVKEAFKTIKRYAEKEKNNPPKEINHPQKEAIAKFLNLGYTYQEIGKQIGLSKQRVHQIVTGYRSPRP